MKNFSIIIPTRQRVNRLSSLIDSIRENANDWSQIEIVLRIDSDDNKTIEFARNRPKFKARILDRSPFISNLWQEAFDLATSDRVMCCADDVLFRTKDWDLTIVKASPDPHLWPYFLYGNDMLQGKGLATLPIMSRPWVNAVGYFMPPGYKVDWCDTHMHDIANRLAAFDDINKTDYIKYFGDVIFEHMHPNNGKGAWDKTYAHRRGMGTEEPQFKRRADERQAAADRLAKYIRSTR